MVDKGTEKFKRAGRTRHRLKALSKEGVARLSVFRSDVHIYAQVIDDATGQTVVSCSSVDKKLRASLKKGGANMAAAEKVGSELAARAKASGVKKVYFDRGSFRYHGRIKALADAARAGGLEF